MPSARGNILPDVPVYYSPPQQSQSSQSSSQSSQPQQSQPTQPTQPPTTTTPPQPDVDVQRSQPSRPKSSRISGPTRRSAPKYRPRRRVTSKPARRPRPKPDIDTPESKPSAPAIVVPKFHSTVPLPDVFVPGKQVGVVRKGGQVHITSVDKSGAAYVTTVSRKPVTRDKLRQVAERLKRKYGYNDVNVRKQGDRYLIEMRKKVKVWDKVKLPSKVTIDYNRARQLFADYAKSHGLKLYDVYKKGDRWVASFTGKGPEEAELPTAYSVTQEDVKRWLEEAGLTGATIVATGDGYEIIYETEAEQKATAALPAYSIALTQTKFAPVNKTVGLSGTAYNKLAELEAKRWNAMASKYMENQALEKAKKIQELYDVDLTPQELAALATSQKDTKLLKAIQYYLTGEYSDHSAPLTPVGMASRGITAIKDIYQRAVSWNRLPEEEKRRVKELERRYGKDYLRAYYLYWTVDNAPKHKVAAKAASSMVFGWIPVPTTRTKTKIGSVTLPFGFKPLTYTPTVKTWGKEYKNWIYAGELGGIGASFILGAGTGAATGVAAGSTKAMQFYSKAGKLYRATRLNKVVTPVLKGASRIPGLARATRWLLTTPKGQFTMLTAFEAPKVISEYKSGRYTPAEVLLHAGRDYALAGGFEYGFSKAFSGTQLAKEIRNKEIWKKYSTHEAPYKKVTPRTGGESYELAKFRVGTEPVEGGTLKTYSARSYVERYLPANGRRLNTAFKQNIRFSKFITPEGDELLVMGKHMEPHYTTMSRMYYTTPVDEARYFFKDMDALGDTARGFRLLEKPEIWQYKATPVDRRIWRYLKYSRMGERPFSLAYRPATASEAFSQTRGLYYLGGSNVKTIRTPAESYTVGNIPESVVDDILGKYPRSLEFWTRYRYEGPGKLVPREVGTIRRFAAPDMQRGWAYEWIKGRDVATMGRKLPTPGEQVANYLRTGKKGFKSPYTVVDDTGYLERLYMKADDIFRSLRSRLPKFRLARGTTTTAKTAASSADDVAENIDDLARYLEKWNGKKPSKITRFTATELEEGIAGAGKPSSNGLIAIQEAVPEEIAQVIQKGTTGTANVGARLLRTGIKQVTGQAFHFIPPIVTPTYNITTPWVEATPTFSPITSQTQRSELVTTPVQKTIQVQTVMPKISTLIRPRLSTVLVPSVAVEELLKFRQEVVPKVTQAQQEGLTFVPQIKVPQTNAEVEEERLKMVPSLRPTQITTEVPVTTVATTTPTIPPVIPPTIPPVIPPYVPTPEGTSELPLGYGPVAPGGMFAYWIGATPFLGGDEEVIIIPRKPKTLEEKLFKEYFEWLIDQGLAPAQAAKIAGELVSKTLSKKKGRVKEAPPQQRVYRNVPLTRQPLRNANLMKLKAAYLPH